jgi:hypothetical protein
MTLFFVLWGFTGGVGWMYLFRAPAPGRIRPIEWLAMFACWLAGPITWIVIGLDALANRRRA